MSSTAIAWRKVEVDGPESGLTAQPPEAIRVQLGAYGLPERGAALQARHVLGQFLTGHDALSESSISSAH
jgi:hypothetical protein